MTTILELTTYLEEIAPLHFQESYDNAGLIYGDPDASVEGVLISLDLTEAVIDDAIANGCNVIVSHHPIIFRGIKKFHGHYVDRTVAKAIKNDIAIYAIHTNLDNVLENGVNGKIAEKIGLKDTGILSIKPELDENGKVGSGVTGILQNEMSEIDFLDHLKKSMELKVVKHTALLDQTIKKVAICGGSGSFLLSAAIRCGADAFITSDFKYHEFFDADSKIVIIDIGHFESEQFTINLLYDLITNKFSNFAARCTKVNTNPVNYY
ncbi:Nif3-like dinuclear metal center hexameric protein [Portibacter lacus]|uniref:GTP cyclohydrolase 1 type 2 homolog n=1 Tax=Portibacter lacus TaxID=1099794 RepID=A0AA37SRG7_9BACT|nr:Nif3-like dinuclear metal center hexameric protein [Portibacter lacus]GLR18517.1 GTP cyclohydrolase 1 type 2 [Portibacter lacus]